MRSGYSDERADRLAADPQPPLAFRDRRSIFRLFGVYGTSRLLGFARELGVAYLFGTTAAADHLSVAFVVASLASIVGGEAVFAATVKSLSTAGPSASDRSFTSLLRASTRLAVGATAVFAIVAPPLGVLVAGPSEEASSDVVTLTLLLAPSVGAGVLAGCANARLTLEGRIARVNVAQLCYSGGALVGLAYVALSDSGTAAVAAGWTAGNLVGLLVLLRSIRPSRDRAERVPQPLRLLVSGLPVALAFALLATQSLTDRLLAGRLGTGDIAALGYADRLFLIPTGFVFAFFAPAVLGALAEGRTLEPRETAAGTQLQLTMLTIWTVPATLLAVAASPVAVDWLFTYGKFDEESAAATVAAFDGLACGIAATSLLLVLMRVMQLVLPLVTLAVVAGLSVLSNAAISLVLSWEFGLLGIALGTSLTSCAAAATQIALVSQRLGASWRREMTLRCLAPAAAALAASGGVAVVADHGADATPWRVGLLATAIPLLALAVRRGIP